MKTLLMSLAALAALALTIPGCDDANGCADLEAKLKSCDPNVTVESCNDDAVAACTAERLDATCSNLVAASFECAGQ